MLNFFSVNTCYFMLQRNKDIYSMTIDGLACYQSEIKHDISLCPNYFFYKKQSDLNSTVIVFLIRS